MRWYGSGSDLAGGIAWLRIAVGAALAIAPRPVLRLQTPDDPSGPLVLMTRTVGIRDVVIGVGSMAAARSGNQAELRKWVGVGLLSDVLDALAGASSARLVGKRGALISGLAPLPVVVADLGALGMLGGRTPTRTGDLSRVKAAL